MIDGVKIPGLTGSDQPEEDREDSVMRDRFVVKSSRRDFLRWSTAVGLTVPTMGILLAACGSDDEDEPTAEDEPAADPTSTPADAAAAETEMEDVESDPTEGTDDAEADPTEAEDEPTESASEGDIPTGGTLIFGLNLNAETLDPHFSARFADRYVMYLMYNTIVGYDEDFNIIPDLAQSWEIDDDGLGITFSLQEGAVFHDGTACDAEAVKWNIERVLDPEINSPQRTQLEPVIDSVEVVDASTVRLVLKEAWRPLLATLGDRAGFIVSPAGVEEFGQEFGRNPIGSGPFQFVEWVDDSHVHVERFEDYWDDGKPYLDRIEFRHIPEDTVRLTAVRTGEIHLADAVDPTLLDAVESGSEVIIESIESGRIVVLWWHLDRPPFDNPDLRAALALATDRQAVADFVYNGTGRIARQPIGTGWAYDPTVDEEVYGFDLDAALERIDAAGVVGETFTLNFGSVQETADMAALLQSQYEQLGITIELAPQNPADVAAQFQEGELNWVTSSWAPRADPDGLLRLLYHSEGPRAHGYSNPEVDQLLDEAAGIYDTDEAATLYREAARLIALDAPMIYLHRPEVFAVRRAEVENFVYHPDLIIRLRDFYLTQ